MDLDDVLDAELFSDEYKLGEFYRQEEFEHEQALISKKSNQNIYSVERGLVNTKEYHDKFDKLPVSDATKQSAILCHNGEVYAIYGVSKNFEKAYEICLNSAKTKTSDMDEAKRLAMTALYISNEKYSDRHKLFDVRRL